MMPGTLPSQQEGRVDGFRQPGLSGRMVGSAGPDPRIVLRGGRPGWRAWPCVTVRLSGSPAGGCETRLVGAAARRWFGTASSEVLAGRVIARPVPILVAARGDSMRCVNRLTSTQQDRMDEWADRWVEVALRTGPADRDRFERAVAQAYGFTGLDWHGRVVWVSSPLVVAVAAALATALRAPKGRGRLDARIRESLCSAVYTAITSMLTERVIGVLYERVQPPIHGAAIWVVNTAVRVAVDAATRDMIAGRAPISDATWAAVTAAAGMAGSDMVPVGDLRAILEWGIPAQRPRVASWRGPWDAVWLLAARDVCRLDLLGDLQDRAQVHETLLESGCWWWPHHDFVIACEPPLVIHREQVRPRGWRSHRLHREDGPALIWPDGWGIWAWHGLPVPRDVIEHPETITARRIFTEPDVEVRRAMCERIGWDEFVAAAGVSVVDECADPANPGSLLTLYDLPERFFGMPARLLLCVNASLERDGTRRWFGLTVPASMDSALAAAAWTFGLNPRTYAGLARAT